MLEHRKGTLSEALDIQTGDVVAFVGAGGKTSLMLSLANELAQLKLKVILTTTTKIGVNERPENSKLIIGMDIDTILKESQEAFDKDLIPVIASIKDDEHDRLIGFQPNIINQLADEFDIMIIEADGARRKPFKVPMLYEPVVPNCVNKLCIVFGLDAINKKISEENFYNSTGMQELGAFLGEPLTVQILRQLLFHKKGYMRFRSDSRKVFLIPNKYDLIQNEMKLQDIVFELFNNDLEKIIVTSNQQKPTVKNLPDNTNHRITGIILAAGMSNRFNGVKQLADVSGKSMVYHVTQQALDSDLSEVVLVAGHRYSEVIDSLGDLLGTEKLSIVENKKYQNGLSTSLVTGIEEVKENTDAVMILLGDQPNITAEILNKLITAYKSSMSKLCVPMITTSDGTRQGNPVILNQRLFPQLLKLIGDIGAREVVRRYLEYGKQITFDEVSQFQINTIEDLNKYLNEVT